MKNYKSIELFAGAGGLALGLEQAGFQHIGLVEKDKDAVATLRLNRPSWNVIAEDITLVAERNLEEEFGIKKGELDLLSGGAPCQSFSTVGKKLGLEDTRGTMFYYYATFLTKLQPKVFLFENVKGLRTHDKCRTYATILQVFKDAGYSVTNAVLNAWDYGTPQKRERFITVGVRNDIAEHFNFEFPKPHDYKPVIGDVKLDSMPPKSECAYYSDNKRKIMELVPPGGCWQDIPIDIAKEYMGASWYLEPIGKGKTGILRRFSTNEPCYAVMTSPSGRYTERCHPLEIRPFSYRENARFQAFPDEWMFTGSLASRYKQVGNAVPVSLARAIGEQINVLLDNSNKRGSQICLTKS